MSGSGTKFRWFIACKLDKKSCLCWSRLCDWALGRDPLLEVIRDGSKSCALDSIDSNDGHCWCGKFRDGFMRDKEKEALKESE